MHVRSNRSTSLAVALCLVLAAPAAFAADPGCTDGSGSVIMPVSGADQGAEAGKGQAACPAVVVSGNGGGVQYDDGSHGTITLDGADGTQIKNVAAGTDPSDAVNVAQLEQTGRQLQAGIQKVQEGLMDYADAGDTATLAASKSYTDTQSTAAVNTAKAYTDQKFAAWNDSFTQYQQQVDLRFNQTDRRISQMGALSTAMTQMTANAANGSGSKGRLAIGVGAQGSEQAVSIGYGKRIGTRASFTLGAAFGGGERSAGAGFGFDL